MHSIPGTPRYTRFLSCFLATASCALALGCDGVDPSDALEWRDGEDDGGFPPCFPPWESCPTLFTAITFQEGLAGVRSQVLGFLGGGPGEYAQYSGKCDHPGATLVIGAPKTVAPNTWRAAVGVTVKYNGASGYTTTCRVFAGDDELSEFVVEVVEG